MPLPIKPPVAGHLGRGSLACLLEPALLTAGAWRQRLKNVVQSLAQAAMHPYGYPDAVEERVTGKLTSHKTVDPAPNR